MKQTSRYPNLAYRPNLLDFTISLCRMGQKNGPV